MTVLKSSLIAADPPIKTQLHTPIYSYNTTALIGLLGYRSRFYKGLFTFSQVYLHLVLSWFFIFFLNKWKILKDVCHTDIILAMDLLPHWIIHITVQLEHSPWDLGGIKKPVVPPVLCGIFSHYSLVQWLTQSLGKWKVTGFKGHSPEGHLANSEHWLWKKLDFDCMWLQTWSWHCFAFTGKSLNNIDHVPAALI